MVKERVKERHEGLEGYYSCSCVRKNAYGSTCVILLYNFRLSNLALSKFLFRKRAFVNPLMSGANKKVTHT